MEVRVLTSDRAFSERWLLLQQTVGVKRPVDPNFNKLTRKRPSDPLSARGVCQLHRRGPLDTAINETRSSLAFESRAIRPDLSVD